MLPPLKMHQSSRVNGLDTLRAAAIILVFMYHYMVFVSHEHTFGWLSEIGWMGVDLFFVLSGYLIANQLFTGIKRGQHISAKHFYARRALRTLPIFWIVLAAYFIFPAVMGGKTPPPLWSFLTFTQNYHLQPGTAFSHAWSLCIEEQFYLIFPLILMAGMRFRFNRVYGWILLFGLILVGVIARILLWQTYGRESLGQVSGYYPHIYYATLCRFDEFLPGIAVALVKNFYPAFWIRMTRYGQLWLGLSVLAVGSIFYSAYHFYYMDEYGYGFFMTAFGYSLIAWVFTLCVVAALCPSSWLYRVRVPGAASIALWSYSIYLSHKPLAYILQKLLAESQWITVQWLPLLTLIVIVLACVIMGAVLYQVEAFFMRVRDRLFPSNFAKNATTAR
ncbi:acyltransferase family protein [Aquirhabdus sp.]|uniref:acyltransferase family protein n=1 Tax=Aquirhabdus sp. TaxID=2824160 RepID=UPI00396CB6B3